MFCVKCGHPLDDGDEFCANCGEAVQKTFINVTEEDSSSDVQPEDTAARKTNLNLLLLIGAGVVVLAALVLLIFNFGAVKNWFVRTSSTPEDMLVTVYKTSLSTSLASVWEDYEKVFAGDASANVSSQAQLVLKPGQQILDMLSQSIYGHSEADMSWLSDIRLGVDLSVRNKLQKNVLKLGLGEHDVVSVELITDAENKKQYLTIPEINRQALMTAMSQSSDMTSADMTKLLDAMPSRQVIERVGERYMDILLTGFSSVEKYSGNMTLDDISQNVTVLEAYIDHTDLLEVVIAALEQAKHDEDVKSILEGLNPWYNDMMEQSMTDYYDNFGSDYEPQDIYAETMAQIDVMLTDLQAQLSDADPENHLYLYTYLDDNNGIVGTKLAVSGIEEPVSSLTLAEDGHYSSEILFGQLQVKGSGSEANGLSGSYAVSVGEDKLLDIKLENVTDTAGVINIEPSAILLEELAAEAGMDSSGAGIIGMADIVLRISFEESADDSRCDVSILSNDAVVLELDISGKLTDGQEIALPENAADSSDEEASASWLMDHDLESLFAKLTEAGVPEELFTALLLTQ